MNFSISVSSDIHLKDLTVNCDTTTLSILVICKQVVIIVFVSVADVSPVWSLRVQLYLMKVSFQDTQMKTDQDDLSNCRY